MKQQELFGKDYREMNSSSPEIFYSAKEASKRSTVGGVPQHWVCLDSVLPKYDELISPSDQLESYVTYPVNLPETHAPKKDFPSLVTFLKPIVQSEERFINLQSWEGIVIEVREGAFVARLIDKSNGGYDQEVEFSFEEVSPYDHSLIKLGAIFYWDIGYSENNSKQRIRASIIKFRRLPVWTANELKAARERAKSLAQELSWENSEPPTAER